MPEDDDKPDRIETPSRKMVKHSAAIQKLLEGGDDKPVETKIDEPLPIAAQKIARLIIDKGWQLETFLMMSDGNVKLVFEDGKKSATAIITREVAASGTPQEIADRIVAEHA